MSLNKTPIEWVKNPDGSPGYSWNPITGCLNGCGYCYAKKLANTRLKERYLANKDVAPYKDERDYMDNCHNPFYPRFWEDKLLPRHSIGSAGYGGRKDKGVFVCDMSDLFGIGIPEEWTNKVLRSIKGNPLDRFYLLTKQPQNLIKFSPFPDNCWVGVTATDYESFYFGATKYLASIKAKVKYISFEPLLEGMGKHIPGWLSACLIDAGIKWVIIGAQTKPYKPPKIEWVREIVEACDKAGGKVFIKDSLWDLLYTSGFDNDIFWANEKAKLRQEMPTGA